MSLSSSNSVALRVLLGTAAVCSLGACEREQTVKLPKDDVVLAKVGGTPITQYDVNQLARRTLGDLGGEGVRQSAQSKLLDGLIQSRAIASAAEKELNPLEKLALERELSSYREQLLVRRYLDRHSPPAPVSQEMIADYYRNHPDRFGGKKRRLCEVLGATRDLSPDQRNSVMKALRDAEHHPDWKEWTETLTKKQLPVSLTSTADDDQLLLAKLGDLIRSLKPGAPSQVVLISGRPYVARLTGEEQAAPRPLAEVRGEIERLLAPAQLSSALERVGKEARQQVEVELLNGAKAPAAPGASAKKGSAP
ncbi:MAG TPA: peptidylprolyl isomerase [Polyangiaceae bacterium]|nr:peptidylprolyl isomerase [Polyangiaceae bacterium]